MTSPPVDDAEALRRILDDAEALFLDFDGPVCNLFAGLPASVVVNQLCVVLADGAYGDPPPEIEKSGDPFDVLEYAAALGKTEAEYVNAAFTAHEVEAAATAEPTYGAHELMRSWSETGRPLAIVSNNSTEAVGAYLRLHSLVGYANHISARTDPDVSGLKPNPRFLLEALSALHLDPNSALFVGDSVADIEASRAAGTVAVGYANKPLKATSLAELRPAALVTTIAILRENIHRRI